MPDAAPSIRPLTLGDAPACESIALEHGWEVGEERWRLMLGLGQGWGCFSDAGTLVGTTFLFSYEERVALVAMVLVRRAFGRQGVGRRLVEQALVRAPPATYLYATAQGRGLYERLGFVAGEDLARYSGRAKVVEVDRRAEVRPLAPGHLEAAVRLDCEAFGASRDRVIHGLSSCAVGAFGAWRGEQLVGYGLATRVGSHVALGPVAALEEPVGVQLVAALSAGHQDPVRLDAPAPRGLLRDWAIRAALAEEASVPLMTLRGQPLPGRRERVIAVASRGLG